MDYRYLGNSGLQISEITYGNWLTHGSQVENDIATQCVRAALDSGISTGCVVAILLNLAFNHLGAKKQDEAEQATSEPAFVH